jgi:hypothetical protein
MKGHEEAVLHRGLETLKREKSNLMIEIEARHAPGSLNRVSALLSGIGYLGFCLDGEQIKPIAHPHRAQVRQNGKTGKYINNFLFFPSDRAAGILESARQYF